MPYNTNGVNYPSPGFTPYQSPIALPYTGYPSYPIPQVQQPNASPVPYSPVTGNPGQIRGRVVQGDSEITPNDVPMDGSPSVFPTNDLSCIFVKQWNKDGTISTVRYVPETTSTATPETSDFETKVLSEIAEMKRMIANKNQHYRKGNTQQSQPQEG